MQYQFKNNSVDGIYIEIKKDYTYQIEPDNNSKKNVYVEIIFAKIIWYKTIKRSVIDFYNNIYHKFLKIYE